MGVFLSVMLNTLPTRLSQDGWLSLVSGRYITQHGLPHSDTLTVFAHGASWVDQQWLSQLASYEAQQLGGLPLYSIMYIFLTVGALGMAIAGAHRLGAADAHIIWVLPIVVFFYSAGSFNIRTQGFAYPLFVGVLWLLAASIRDPRRKVVYWVFPLLILWANLHGSAVIGAGLAVFYGLSLVCQEIPGLSHRWRINPRIFVFVIGGPLCLLCTPYGLSMLTYYHETLTNPLFKQLIIEWHPILSFGLIIAAPFFLTAFVVVWLFGYGNAKVALSQNLRSGIFTILVLVTLIAATVSVARNLIWFSLALVVLFPPYLSTIFKPRPTLPHRRLDLALLGASAVFLLLSLMVVLSQPSAWFQGGYSPHLLNQVKVAVQQRPDVRVYAEGRFSDWLLWEEPSLAGRIAYDSRLELLTSEQLRAIVRLEADGVSAPGTPSTLDGYGLLMLDTSNLDYRYILKQPGVHVLSREPGVVIATRSGK
jgi:MFS family permease